MQLNDIDRTLSALADPTRRAILARLSSGEARVTDLAAPFEISLNAVSKHIRVLEQARLVRRRRAGREHILALDPAPMAETLAWMEQAAADWTHRLKALDAILAKGDSR